jgi:hypothetical protein
MSDDTGDPSSIVIVAPTVTSTVVTFVVMSVLLCTSVGAHLALLLHRDHPVIKAASRRFSHLIVFGASLVYVGGGVHVLEKQSQWICTLPSWLLGLGFAFVMGALLDKTVRIHQIFNAKTMQVYTAGTSLWLRLTMLVLCEVIGQLIWFFTDRSSPKLFP